MAIKTKTHKAIRNAALALRREMIEIDRSAENKNRNFGQFCEAIGLDVEDWKQYRNALVREAGKIKTANPSAWEALAWVRANRPAMC